MSVFRMRLPDVGEGVAEAEIVDWHVAVGDEVTTESVLAEVLTDKATIEVSSPVDGRVVALHGEVGDVLAVGGDLVEIETDDPAPAGVDRDAGDGDVREDDDVADDEVGEQDDASGDAEPPLRSSESPSRVAAAPAVRARATDLGIDLTGVSGSGPQGRVVHADLDRILQSAAGARTPTPRAADTSTSTPVRGVRRRIAARLTEAWQTVPHITYVDDVDLTHLLELRAELNRDDRGVRLTLLPFIARAIALACADQPHLNARYDHDAETLTTHDAVHLGVATQTDAGLLVPVVRDVGSRALRELAAEIGRVTAAARDGTATRDELSGSTISITSLGALGGLATTPIINAPEVAIVGVNKMETRPVWRDGAFVPRQMCNLSSSFDHRIVDGWDAARFVQRIKALLEMPALLFVDD